MFVAIQLNSKSCVETNLYEVAQQLKKLPKQRPLLVVLPECFALFDAGATAQLEFAQDGRYQQVLTQLSQWCLEYKIWMVAGTVPIPCDEKFYAASLVFDDTGRNIAQYNKIHLFDVEIDDGTKSYRESTYTEYGQQLVVVDSPFGKLGVAVCYDIRFPGLFSAMSELGAEVVAIPAAFTVPTGLAHWQPLLQARAIENQIFVVAAATVGQHDNGRETYGHSMVIDPWGEIVANAYEDVGNIVYLANRKQLCQIRNKMPVLTHSKFKYEFKND